MKIGILPVGEVRPDLPATPVWDGNAPLILGDGWALGADNLQWMVMQARVHKGGIKWQPVAFIGSTRRVLRRVLRELGVELSPDGEAALNGLNETFREWREATR